MLTETITWRPVAEGLPDAELTVLIACDTKFHSEPVWIGFHDGEAWREANGEPAFVTHWAQLPAAPADARMDEQKGESVQAHVQVAAPAGVAVSVTGWKTDKLGSSLAWPADTSTDAAGVAPTESLSKKAE